MKRKEAACKIHEYLRDSLHEADEIDTAPALKLQDLFDCRVCAGHVMQVYVKGIMEAHRNADGRLIFGMDDEVLPEEAEKIKRRVFERELRNPKKSEELCVVAERVTKKAALQMCMEDKTALLVDVRTNREYDEGHIENARNIPVLSLLKNPYAVSTRRDQRIYLYCGAGYQSEAAARCLLEAGYEKVFYFAWDIKEES